jgi:predicted RecA/RadA family phage recombinase
MYFAHNGVWNKLANDNQLINSSNWDTAYSWGDHSTQGYILTETDPLFMSSAASLITNFDITNWNNAYFWGDHNLAGYVLSYGLNYPTFDGVAGDVLTTDGFGNLSFSSSSSVNGTSQRYNYTATSGQTTFTGSDNNGNTLTYDAGYIDVYLNGVKLLNGTDVTVTSGSSVVLASGATTGDVVDIVAYGTFSVASLNADNLDSGTVPTARVSGAYTGITQTGTLSSLNVDASAGTGVIGITLDNGTVSTSKDSSSFRSQLSMFNTTGQVGRFDTASDDLFLRFADDLAFQSIAGSEYMRIDNSGHAIIPAGVTLGTSAGTYNASNTLDDYEKGTWTPTALSGITGFNIVRAEYVKIGDLVHVRAYLNTFTGAGASQLEIGGLPFSTGNDGYSMGAFEGGSTSGKMGITRTKGNGSSFIVFYPHPSTALRQNYTGNDLGNFIIFSIAYTIN